MSSKSCNTIWFVRSHSLNIKCHFISNMSCEDYSMQRLNQVAIPCLGGGEGNSTIFFWKICDMMKNGRKSSIRTINRLNCFRHSRFNYIEHKKKKYLWSFKLFSISPNGANTHTQFACTNLSLKQLQTESKAVQKIESYTVKITTFNFSCRTSALTLGGHRRTR